MLHIWLSTVGEPIDHEAWHWFHSVVGEGRRPLVDTWWQTGETQSEGLPPSSPSS